MDREIFVKTFDQLTTAELYELLRLRVDVFVVEQNCPYPELDGEDLHAGTLHLWIAARDNAMAACARVLPPGTRFKGPAIGRVAVASQHRGRGLAHDLVARAVAEAKMTWPGRAIGLSAQAYLTDFYRGHGFSIVSKAYMEDGIPHIDMELDPV